MGAFSNASKTIETHFSIFFQLLVLLLMALMYATIAYAVFTLYKILKPRIFDPLFAVTVQAANSLFGPPRVRTNAQSSRSNSNAQHSDEVPSFILDHRSAETAGSDSDDASSSRFRSVKIHVPEHVVYDIADPSRKPPEDFLIQMNDILQLSGVSSEAQFVFVDLVEVTFVFVWPSPIEDL